MVTLAAILEVHAEALFPLIFEAKVTETLVWDGPDSLEELRAGLREREAKMRAGLLYNFAILNEEGAPIGTIGIVPDVVNAGGSIGLWIGEPFHGRGYGTAAVGLIVAFGFEELRMERLEARVFVGNDASRRIFEKNGFVMEGRLRRVLKKRGVFRDEWVLGMVREEWAAGVRGTA